MKKHFFTGFFALLICATVIGQTNIYVDKSKKGVDISENLYGIFFEEISHAGDGGLYPEIIQNRGFEEHVLPSGCTYRDGRAWAPSSPSYETGQIKNFSVEWNINEKKFKAWSVTKNSCSVVYDVIEPASPLHENTPNAFQLKISNMSAGGNAKLINSGYWGVVVRENEKYNLRFYLRTNDYTGRVTAKVLSSSGSVLATHTFEVKNDGEWTEYKTVFTASGTTYDGTFELEFNATGTILVDYVSLFPQETFKGRKNGLRKDLAQFLADLEPAFMRWPGGCVVEGLTIENRIRWEETLGDPMTRRGEWMRWGYRSTLGFGYHEFLQFCEDMGADAMFVANVGISCGFNNGDYVPESEYDRYVQNIRNAIEYAKGDITTEWGAKRAANGHAEPFPLKYVELGNEHWALHYAGVYNYFYSRLKAEYPEITFICTYDFGSPIASITENIDMIDPHWYVNPDFFFNNVTLFDKKERGKYDVYVGEYACNQGVGAGTMEAALSEAAFMTGMERNSDLVKLTSYAPLIENSNQRNWATNMIWQNNEQVVGRSSYYVQKMFSNNRPDYNIETTIHSDRLNIPCEGRIGLGTWNTSAEYRSVKITQNNSGKVFYQTDFINNMEEWIPVSGSWNASNGVYRQTNTGVAPAISMMGKYKFNDCTFEVEARKISGSEGFLIVFGTNENDTKNYYQLNIGGWLNKSTAIESVTNSSGTIISEQVPFIVNNNQWYKIKIVIKNETSIDCYIDDTHIVSLHFSETKPGRLQSISGYDKKAGETVVKIVNAEDKSLEATIFLNAKNIQSKGNVITLSADDLSDENSFKNPTYISPVITEFSGFSSEFTYTFKPNSLTILRIKSDEDSDGELVIPGSSYSDEPVELYPKAVRLVNALKLAKENYVSYANSASSLQSEIANSERLLRRSDYTEEEANTQANILLAILNTYFKAQMLTENEKTSFIANPGFKSTLGWKGTTPVLGSNVAEFYSTTFNMKQTIEGLENGYYMLNVQAFYRNGAHDIAYPSHNAGTENLNVALYANESSVPVTSIYDHVFNFGWNGYCNTMREAEIAFTGGVDNFANYVIANVTDGTLKIGLKKTDIVDKDWCCFDNFRLFNIPDPKSSIGNIISNETFDENALVFDLFGRMIGRAKNLSNFKPGIYIMQNKKILIR